MSQRLRRRDAYAGGVEATPAPRAPHSASTPGSYYLPTPFDRNPDYTPDRTASSFVMHEAEAVLQTAGEQ